MVTVRDATTGIVVIVNVAEPWPDGMLTVSGGCAMARLSDCTFTVTPVIGAGSPSVTVALTLLPPMTVLLFKVNCKTGITVSGAVLVLLPRTAVITTDWAAVTIVVGIGKAIDLLLNGTVMETGGCAAPLSLDI